MFFMNSDQLSKKAKLQRAKGKIESAQQNAPELRFHLDEFIAVRTFE